jgi:hypothetical protein
MNPNIKTYVPKGIIQAQPKKKRRCETEVYCFLLGTAFGGGVLTISFILAALFA